MMLFLFEVGVGTCFGYCLAHLLKQTHGLHPDSWLL